MAKLEWKEDDRGCWIWQLAIHHSGYGAKCYKQKQYQAHRYVWLVVFGKEIPNDLLLLHKCGVKACVNPAHLYLGTYKDNAIDRHRLGEQLPGEGHPRARLTERDVKAIRKYEHINYNAVARKYGVDSKTIWNAYNKKTWTQI